MIKQGVILASGLGSRLNSEGRNEPKPLMPVGGMALIERVITLMQRSGIEKIIVVVGYRGDQIREYIKKNNIQGVVFAENTEYNKKNGISLLRSQGCLDDAPFLLSMSDHIFSNDFFADFIAAAEPKLEKYEVVLSVDRNIEGVFDLDDATKVVTENGEIVRIGKELPSYDAVDTGLFLCRPGIFPRLQKLYDETGDVSISDAMRAVAEERKFISADMTGHLWQDVDTPSMKDEAEERLIDNYLKHESAENFFSNRFFFHAAKEVAMKLFGKEHFDWNIVDTSVLILSLIFSAIALKADIVWISIIPLFMVTLLFYLDKIKENVRTKTAGPKMFIFSWKSNFILAVMPALLSFCGSLFVGLLLFGITILLALAKFFGIGEFVFSERAELPVFSDEFSKCWLSPSFFCVIYTILVIVLPASVSGLFPFIYFLLSPFFYDKRD